ncbi:hypothetical protein PIB30_053422 [Stylosanthes scabra]|uniref:Uncharacterized protein n=1 Tax=Stylosanthes scabra TaxID=79078 RepID=A0ABU6YHC0_9FABA|nr:hypothetical protein [Stylosanthes scabra]
MAFVLEGGNIFVTTGPSSGGADDPKILDMLNRVFTRSAMEFGKKIYQTRLEFEVGIEFGKSGGLVVKRSARTADLFESKSLTHGESTYIIRSSSRIRVKIRIDQLKGLLSDGSLANSARRLAYLAGHKVRSISGSNNNKPWSECDLSIHITILK